MQLIIKYLIGSEWSIPEQAIVHVKKGFEKLRCQSTFTVVLFLNVLLCSAPFISARQLACTCTAPLCSNRSCKLNEYDLKERKATPVPPTWCRNWRPVTWKLARKALIS